MLPVLHTATHRLKETLVSSAAEDSAVPSGCATIIVGVTGL
jgi:hypothetical protein